MKGFCWFSFRWWWKVASRLENIPISRLEFKTIPYLWPKRLKIHTRWGGTYLYSPYKGVPPRGGGLPRRSKIWVIALVFANWAVLALEGIYFNVSELQSNKFSFNSETRSLFPSEGHKHCVFIQSCVTKLSPALPISSAVTFWRFWRWNPLYLRNNSPCSFRLIVAAMFLCRLFLGALA